MYRVIVAATDTEAVDKLADKVWSFADGQCKYAREHSFLLYELGVKSFTRTIAGKKYIFKLLRGVLTVTCDGQKVGSLNLNQGYNNVETRRLAEKVIKHSQK